MECTRAFRVLMSAISETPAVIGWMRPVILLPAATVAGLTVEQLETVLAHEIAHIRRHDYLINFLQIVVETLLFYHPAVWWISSRIRLERELCCDDEVVRATGDPAIYARALVTLEKLRAPAPVPAMAIGSAGSQLSYRIRRLVGQAPPPRGIWPAILALALTLTCVTIVSVDRARGQQAQDTVTVEVTRDEQGAVSGVRVLSGLGYLRALALQAAVQMPAPPGVPRRVFTFPAAFHNIDDQSAMVQSFIRDVVAEAERNVQTVASRSPVNEREIMLAREKLAQAQYRQTLAGIAPIPGEKAWKVQVLSHDLTEFREKYRGKLLNNASPALAAQYDRLQDALSAAEQDLKNVGPRQAWRTD